MRAPAIPNSGPTPRDLCAVAISMAARMCYAAQTAWHRETSGQERPAWEELPAEQRANTINFVLTLASRPELTAEDMHDMARHAGDAAVPASAHMAFSLCSPAYRANMNLAVSTVRSVIDHLVSRPDMREYIGALDDGSDEFMLEH